MAKKMRPSLTEEQKKHLAYNRKKGVLIIIIVLLSILIAVEVGFLIFDLLNQAGT